MSAQENKKLLQQYFSVVSGTETGVALGDFFSDDVVWYVPQTNPDIKPNPRVGHAAVMDLLNSGTTIFQAGTMDIHMQRLLADEDCVTAQFTMKAKLANGAAYENHYVMLFAVDCGKISGVWEYLDTHYLWQQRQ